MSDFLEEIIAQQKREYSHACTKDVYAKYRSGELSKDEWVLYLNGVLTNYMKYIIRKKCWHLAEDAEDLLSQGTLAIVEYADKYNPARATPTSYFTRYIEQYMREGMKKTMTKHYSTAAKKMDKVLRTFGYSGIDDPKLSPEKISILTDLSVKTVKKTMEQVQISVASLSSTSENFETSAVREGFQNPEKIFLEKEEKELLIDQLDKCSRLEQYLLGEIILSTEPKSYRQVLIELKDPELGLDKEFEDELPKKLNQLFLEQKVSHALRKIAYSQAAKRLYQREQPFEYVQASEEDILAAIEVGKIVDI